MTRRFFPGMLKLTRATIFRIDCAGALMTAILLSAVLPRFEACFGMHETILLPLAGIAFIYALYSGLSSLLTEKNNRLWLRAISIANVLYCLLTAALAIIYRHELTFAGFVYFFGEITIILALALIEWKASVFNK